MERPPDHANHVPGFGKLGRQSEMATLRLGKPSIPSAALTAARSEMVRSILTSESSIVKIAVMAREKSLEQMVEEIAGL